MTHPTFTEVLESRIAPALVIVNPISDIIVGAGSTGKTIELSQMFDPLLNHPGHTIVTFVLNFDSDLNTPGLQPAEIKLELFDNEAPLTVQNFLRYATENDSAYLNTFLHRLFDFGTGSGSGMDIIQGGGFPANDIREHIDTLGQVHNEYSDSRPNTAGTIAMAKTGLGPNTATSEWFININDNSSILGSNNNSGFTVFGQVIQGMDVIQRLAVLDKAEKLGGALTDLPIQNMNPDPDNNPETASPTPKPDNLIRITDVKIAAPEVGNVQGITYRVQVVSGGNIIQTPPEDIVGSQLQLNYIASQNGVATLRIIATRGEGEDAEEAIEEFTVTLRPNLIGTVSEDAMGSILLPGEGGKTKIKIQNNGGANFVGAATIKFYLSARDADDTEGTILDEDDILLLSQAHDLTVNAAGEFEITIDDLRLARSLIPGETDDYRLIVEIETADGTPEQLFTDDDVAIDGGVHVLTNSFGTLDFTSGGFGKRTNVKLVYDDPQTGNTVALSLKGPGTGKVTLDQRDKENDTDDQAELHVLGTSAKSKLIMDAAAESLTFSQVEVTDFVGLVDFTKVHQLGNVALSGGAKSVIFGDSNETAGDIRLTIGAAPGKDSVSIKLGQVKDLSIESLQPIKSIEASSWRDTLNPENSVGGINDSITAPSLGSLKINGDLEANVETYTTAKLSKISVSGSIKDATIRSHGNIGSVVAGGLTNADIIAINELSSLSVTGSIIDSSIEGGSGIGKMKVNGLTDSTVSTNSNLSSFSASGTVDDTTFEIDGTMKKFAADALLDSSILAGTLAKFSVAGLATNTTIRSLGDIGNITVGGLVTSNVFAGTDARPASVSEFDTISTIKSLTIKGIDGVTSTFVDSQIAASAISKILVRGVDGASGDSAFGIVADKVGKYIRVDGQKLSKLDTAQTLDTVGNYQLLILAPPAST